MAPAHGHDHGPAEGDSRRLSIALGLILALMAGEVTAGVLADSELPVRLGLIWLAHIGADRLLGYGLKYPTGFKDSHLQRV